MFNNYLYLLRGLNELKEIILGREIVDIYTQEKDNLFLKIPLKSNPDFTLILSTHSQSSYFSIKPDHKKAKKNTKEFFKNYLPAKITDILIAKDDRIIKIVLSQGTIFFLIRGVKSNVYFFYESNVELFKKTNKDVEELTIAEIKATEFVNSQESFKRIKNDVLKYDRESLMNSYRFWDKSLIREIQVNDWNSKLVKILDDVMNNTICINIMEDSGVNFLPGVLINSQEGQSIYYSSYFDALNKFISLKHVVKRDVSAKKELEKYLGKELERISNKLNEIKAKIEKGSNEKELSYLANLLLTNIHNIRKGMESIKIYDSVKDSEITITLDKTLSPNKNVDKYFEKSKSEKINYQKAKILFSDLQSQYTRLVNLHQKLNNSLNYDDIITLKKEIGIKSKMEIENKSEESNYRQFIIENKYHLYVGKNSKNNDELTTRFAKQNDLWFHARSVSGSHVVLRIENTKEPVPKNIIKKAASVAAYYSKAKTSKLASVSYTFKKYVTKRKDLEPGQVILLREQVILVPPEIPDGCVAVD